MDEIRPSYLSGNEDLENLPYPLASLGQNEACTPLPCPGGVEIVLVGSGEPAVGTFPEENSVITSFSRLDLREDNREGMRLSLPMEPDGIPRDIMGRPEQDHLTPTIASPKFNLPSTDHHTLHHLNTHPSPNLASAWSFPVPDPQEERTRDGEGESSDGQYIQDTRFEWTSGLEDIEGHSELMMVRSDPPPITMPVFRKALQLGGLQETWQRGTYSEEEAQVEVEEEEDDEEDGSVYTCIECSIYFKRKAHLLEHMFQHSQEGEGEGTHLGDGPYACSECGKGFGDEGNLAAHRRLHQESRQRIMEEISKLESLTDEGRGARLQCPKCLFGTNSSKVFVQHAKSHVRKGSGESQSDAASLKAQADMVEEGETSEQGNDGTWTSSESEAGIGQGWEMEVPCRIATGAKQGLGKAKRKFAPRVGGSLQGEQWGMGRSHKPTKGPKLPETAVELKRQFREALKAGGGGEEGQRWQLREEVAIVVLENFSSKRKKAKGHRALGHKKKLFGSSEKLPLPSCTSSVGLQLPREAWEDDGEGGIPLDVLLMDPNYERQLEALGLRSEERECPYCPDRFHNGIGLANHVRGHLNRVGVSYNVRHFISAEEVKAIEQHYAFQKKRKKVANFDPSTFSLMRCEFCGAGFDTRAGLSSHARAHLRDFGITNWELTVSPIHVLTRLLARSPGRPLPPFPSWQQDTDTDVFGSDEEEGSPLDLMRPQVSKQDPGHVVEKMPSDNRTEDPKGPVQSTTCEVCGACFGTRKGLSSHARSHLRHLGVAESESSGAPIDLLYELAKQGKLPQDVSMGAKKAGSPRPGSPRGQWGDEDGPLNLTMDGEPGKDTDCQFCGAWFETRKGLSSHARAHLRHLGVNDPDAKGSPIAVLHSLIKSEDFKKRYSGHAPTETDTHTKASSDSTSTETSMSTSNGTVHKKLTQAGTFSKVTEGKGNSGAAKISEAGTHSMNVGGGARMVNNSGSADVATHFKCPSGSSSSTHMKAGASHSLSSEVNAHSKLVGHSHKMLNAGTHSKVTLSGLTHSRPPPTGTPPTKKLKTASPVCKASMEAFWSSSNPSTPLNLSPGSEEVRCEFCGEFFENRKGLSSHARSHLRQMGVTEWHVNGSPIDTLREILASGTYPRAGNRVGGPTSGKLLPRSPPPSSPSRPHPFSGLSPVMQNKQSLLPTYPGSDWPSDLSPLNLSSRADPTRDIRCEFCNEFFENRKGLSSHARSHLRQMGVTEWHVNGSPIDTLREIIRKRRPSQPHLPNIKKEPLVAEESESPSRTLSPLGLGLSGISRELPVSPLAGRPHNTFLSPLGTKRPASHEPRPSHSEPKSYVHLEPKTYIQGEGRPPAYIQEEERPSVYLQGEGRPSAYTQSEGRPKVFMQDEGRPKPFMQGEGKPKAYPKSFVQAEGKHKSFVHGEAKAKSFVQGEGKSKSFVQGEGKAKSFVQGEGKAKQFVHGEGKAKPFMHGEGKPKQFMHGEGKPKPFMHGEGKPKPYLHGEGKPKPYLQGEGKPKSFMHGEGKPKLYVHGEGKMKAFTQGEGKSKAYIQTELPFKVKLKTSPDKTAATSMEACCELCGLFFENRKALASHSRAHLRQFGVTEWCVNGSPIETLREWMKQRPQKAGAYLSYIQGGRPLTKKFKRSSQTAKAGAAERENPVAGPTKVAEAEKSSGTPGATTEKPTEGQAQKPERRASKPPEVPPAREETITEPIPKPEEQRPPPKARPVPSLVPRPPQTSLVKFVGNIYTLKCRFCDIQFQGPLSIQEQWVRHLQHHILEMNFSKPPSPPDIPSPAQPEPSKAQ
ncbi:protein Wiz [Rhinophrynus dorsalis]